MNEEAPRYNRVFEMYVNADDDLVGLVAYALYKERKRAWIIETKEQAGAVALDQAALDSHERNATLELTVRDFREKAESVLAAYSDAYVELQTPRIREEAISKEISDARAGIDRSTNYTRQLGQSLIVSVITVIVMVLLVVATALFGIDPLDGLRSLTEATPNPER